MHTGLTPLTKAAIGFAYVGGFTFVAVGVYLSYRRRRLHPLLLDRGLRHDRPPPLIKHIDEVDEGRNQRLPE